MEQSYAETLGVQIFDWEGFFKDKKASITPDIVRLACNWNTCAVGQLPAGVPRDTDRLLVVGYPDDVTLRQLGKEFAIALNTGDKDHAYKVMRQIQKYHSMMSY